MDANNKPKGEYVEFIPPADWQPPELDPEAEGEFDLVCRFRAKPDGRICMLKLGETDMPQKKEKEKAPGYREYGQSIVEGTTQMMDQSNQEPY